MSDRDAQPFAQVSLVAGALFVRGEDVLLVHAVDRGGWDIPGGSVAPGESPAAGCRRAIGEELGLDRPPCRLLVHDWTRKPAGDQIRYIFDCGELGDESAIQLRTSELDHWRWVRVDTVDTFARPEPSRRIWQAFRARMEGHAAYLEHGEPALSYPDTAAPSWLDRQPDRDRHLG
ncbi:NUDIX domain-containing protein [Nocardia anaemiae]|uniref:NUDIX domain-containing protein n=1 Tax=Nocardia anaemiae TaxID=263910 RepID=UPI0007C75CF5|nr:NUDIX hydrolase [Nocardia anaemiae]